MLCCAVLCGRMYGLTADGRFVRMYVVRDIERVRGRDVLVWFDRARVLFVGSGTHVVGALLLTRLVASCGA
jgi:hypothetical protein